MVLYDGQTLVFRHLPNELSKEDKIDFLKFFGANEVKFISSKSSKYNVVFAKFRSRNEAEAVLKKLHQTEIFDQLISVEFARGSDLKRNISVEKQRENEAKEEQTTQRKHLENFLQKLNSWTNHLDFNQPPPVHVKYQYPPPTLRVVSNIAKALASVPKFYTQVLHLMNKMNLPCPFSENFCIESDIVSDDLPQDVIINEKIGNMSEEESEIESEEEIIKKEDNIVAVKRKISKIKKAIKKPKLIKPSPAVPPKPKSCLKTEDVFEKGQIEAPKKIEVKVSGDLKRLEEEKEEIIGEEFEKVLPVAQEQPQKPEEDSSTDDGRCITAEELAINRISSKDQHILPVFKNYQAGVPSCRLYIKNLAKNVSAADLSYIYKRYLLPIQEEQGSMFDIQLLQEGRMKGQAFISLQNVEQAKLALKETNGYILKGKPMVVQYARSSKPK